MKSRIFSSKIKAIHKGQTWIPAFIVLGFLLAFPVTGLIKISSWTNVGYTGSQKALLYMHLWEDGFILTGTVVAMIAAFLNSMNGFIYLYSGKKTDFYHSLPQNRTDMFLERIVTGLIYYLIPYIVMEFLMVCIGAARGFFSIHLMTLALKMAVVHLAIYLVIYFSFVLVICVTGNMLMGALCVGGMYLYGITLSLLVACYGSSFLQTYYGEGRFSSGSKFLTEYLSPGALAINLACNYADGHVGKLFAGFVILGIVLAVLAYLAYQNRPSETAGKSMVYRWVAVLVKFIVVVPSGLGIGWIFYSAATGKSKTLWWIFGMLLGTVLIHGMIETIYHMSFQKFFIKKVQLILAGILVAGCALICQKDLLHFDSYIPEKDEIASININTNFDPDYYAQIEKEPKEEFYTLVDRYDWENSANAFKGKDGIGDETYKALKNIVAHSSTAEASSRESYYTGIKYTLKSGRSVYRGYWIGTEDVRALVRGLYEEENLKEQKYRFFELDTEYLNTVQLVDAEGMSYNIFQNDLKKEQELLDALKEDVEAATTEDLMEPPTVNIDLSYKLPCRSSINNLIPGQKNETVVYTDWVMGIYPSFKNTLAILKETGYPLSIEELDITKISIVYYGDDASEPETVTYDAPEEVKSIRKALVSLQNGYLNDNDKVIPEISVTVYTDRGEVMQTLGLSKEEIPDFVRDKMNELGINLK